MSEKLILIVEDDHRNYKLFNDILKMHGYKTVHAENGKQGIFTASDISPDLILMDILMPVMDGLEAAQIIKKDPKTKDIPLIALTANVMDEDRKKIADAGFDDYIAKPVLIKTLVDKVKEYL